MEPKKPVNVFIPLALAIIAAFYFMVWRNFDFIPSLVLIAAGLLLYFAFIQVLRHGEKIWFFLMFLVFLIAGLFCLAFTVPANAKLIPAGILLLWLAALKMLYSGDAVDAALLKPSVEKILLLVCFLIFVPTPMYLIFQIGYLPIFHFILSIIAGMVDAEMAALLNAIPAIGTIMAINAIFGFAYYAIICLMQRRAVLRVTLLAITVLMIITAVTQKVYMTEGEGTDIESTAIELYKSLYEEIRTRNRVDAAPPTPHIIIQKKEDAVKGPEPPSPVDPSTIKEMPKDMRRQRGRSEPGYDIER